jgi:DNA-binding NtrC family response regulator
MADKIRLLFVDDEEDFVTYMTKHLERHDLDVHAYLNPVQALKETDKQTFDVGLLDLKMPEIDGEELLKRLKQRDPKIEIIILTGHGHVESAFRSAKAGAYEYLLKPCDFDELVAAINSAYAKRIKALNGEKAGKVDELMKDAGGMSPLALLKKLKSLHDGVADTMAAAAMAEGGDSDTAREVLGKKGKKGGK